MTASLSVEGNTLTVAPDLVTALTHCGDFPVTGHVHTVRGRRLEIRSLLSLDATRQALTRQALNEGQDVEKLGLHLTEPTPLP